MGAGMARHVFFFFLRALGALRKLCTLHIVSFISHRPDCKGTLASDLKGAGARDINI